MKKQTSTAFLSLALIGTMALPAFAADSRPLQPVISEHRPVISEQTRPNQYAIQINGEELDAAAHITVPLRAVAEKLGFAVTWKDGSVLLDNDIVHTTVTIGVDRYQITTSKENMVGMSAPFSLGVAPYIEGGVAYVPLKLFGALLGNREGVIRLEDNQIIIQTVQPQIPNPFVTCDTLEEAEKVTGFSVMLPERLPGWVEETEIRATKLGMIEVVYTGKGNEISLRKAEGTEDISGDYHVYSQVDQVTVNGAEVTLKGENEKIKVASWTNGEYTYAIRLIDGMEREDILTLIGSVS